MYEGRKVEVEEGLRLRSRLRIRFRLLGLLVFFWIVGVVEVVEVIEVGQVGLVWFGLEGSSSRTVSH